MADLQKKLAIEGKANLADPLGPAEIF